MIGRALSGGRALLGVAILRRNVGGGIGGGGGAIGLKVGTRYAQIITCSAQAGGIGGGSIPAAIFLDRSHVSESNLTADARAIGGGGASRSETGGAALIYRVALLNRAGGGGGAPGNVHGAYAPHAGMRPGGIY